MHPYHARRYAKSIGQEVPLDQAVGRVAAEAVEVYPPGIPVILEGFRVSEDAVRYLREARDLGGASSRATRRSRRYASSSPARISAVVAVSPSRGKIRSTLLAWTSALLSVIASVARTTW